MKHAEKNFRKFLKEAIPWKPELTVSRNCIAVWRLVIRQLKGYTVCTKIIVHKNATAGIAEINTILTLQAAETALHEAFLAYKKCTITTKEARITFLK